MGDTSHGCLRRAALGGPQCARMRRLSACLGEHGTRRVIIHSEAMLTCGVAAPATPVRLSARLQAPHTGVPSTVQKKAASARPSRLNCCSAMELKVAGEYGYVVAVATASWVRALSSRPSCYIFHPLMAHLTTASICLQAVCMWMGAKVGQARKQCVPIAPALLRQP